MKIYTVSRDGVDPSARVDTMFLPDGRNIPAVILGEEGCGRKLTYVPVTLTPASRQKWERDGWVEVEDVVWRYNRKGHVHLRELDEPSREDEYLVVLLGWIGFRGSNALTDSEGEALGREVVLAEGRIAQGAAGRMGSGSQWLLKVKPGDLLRYQVSGRLYGEPGEYVIHCTAAGPQLYSEEVWHAVSELEA